ncbi:MULTISPECIES: TadE/TadG family type IV pilus assembly protein [Neorhizobium]|jgi:Flp pilus assembly protein TadG|uniref:TadE/TadG family type IV pilus assembly protein n=1 Tax=Neorhizobium TaxID=1525371 RepID=UPI000CFA6F32|nr:MULTISPECIES: TadE/TadG family type IV pilus assembly protein [Neorhizobium]TCV61748.1 Flp pilus assembly protein TadG [Neorhizobium sp. S3-V5DH]
MGENQDETEKVAPAGRGAVLGRIFRSQDGAAAIEFALLALPYFMIVFAILETFVAYTGEQLVANAVDTVARKLRTGSITAANTDRTAFRRTFCDEVSIMIKCSEEEIATPDKLWLDVRSFPSFADIPGNVPLNTSQDLDTASVNNYSPGAQKTINMVRAYYRWDVITDLLRPYITNIRPSGGRPNYFLIVETATFRNEDYP